MEFSVATPHTNRSSQNAHRNVRRLPASGGADFPHDGAGTGIALAQHRLVSTAEMLGEKPLLARGEVEAVGSAPQPVTFVGVEHVGGSAAVLFDRGDKSFRLARFDVR